MKKSRRHLVRFRSSPSLPYSLWKHQTHGFLNSSSIRTGKGFTYWDSSSQFEGPGREIEDMYFPQTTPTEIQRKIEEKEKIDLQPGETLLRLYHHVLVTNDGRVTEKSPSLGVTVSPLRKRVGEGPLHL